MPIARLKGVEDILNAANALHELLEQRARGQSKALAIAGHEEVIHARFAQQESMDCREFRKRFSARSKLRQSLVTIKDEFQGTTGGNPPPR